MVWKITNVKEEKLQFIGDWLGGKFDFSKLCECYGISRKTGYKLINRYREEGEQALEERSRARHHHPNLTPRIVQARLLELKHRYPHWGPRKLQEWLKAEEPFIHWPAISTIGDLLKHHGLVKARKKRRRIVAYTEPFLECEESNQVWSADFKGQFRLGNEEYCYPLTITDNYSRFLLGCEGLKRPGLKATQRRFEQIFKEYGLPEAIRTDNGQPFAGLGIGGLTALNIWWLKLGIRPERIQAGCPQQNGRHERMHRTLKEATASPSQANWKRQQESFDAFRKEYNQERPHQALGGKRPGEVYTRSKRCFPDKLPEVVYPHYYEVRQVKTNGDIKWAGRRYYLSELLHGEPVGLEMIDDGRAILYFAKAKLGVIDARHDKIIRP